MWTRVKNLKPGDRFSYSIEPKKLPGVNLVFVVTGDVTVEIDDERYDEMDNPPTTTRVQCHQDGKPDRISSAGRNDKVWVHEEVSDA